MATTSAQTFARNGLEASKRTLTPGVYEYYLTLPPASDEFIGVLKAENAGGSSVSAVIEMSPNGVDWFAVYTLATAGNAIDTDDSIQRLFGRLRATITVAAAPADVTLQMWYDPNTAR